MAGRRWEKLIIPADALPNLMHLNCSPFHAAKILHENSSRPLFCLTGIDIRPVIKLSDFFDTYEYDVYEEEEEEEEIDKDSQELLITPPWQDELFSKLKSSHKITHVALHQNDGAIHVGVLAELMPQIRWIDVGWTAEKAKASCSRGYQQN